MERPQERYVPRVGDKVWAHYLISDIAGTVAAMRVLEGDGRIYAQVVEDASGDWRWYPLDRLRQRPASQTA